MFSKLRKRIASKKNEEGAGFVGLIGISMLVTLTASSVVASATFGTYTTNTRLSQQKAQDASEAGVAEAISRISSGEVIVEGESQEIDYKYNYKIYGSSENIAPTEIDPNEIKTEPGYPDAGDKWLIVKSTGESTNTMNAESTILATYKWQDNTNVAVIPQAISADLANITNSEISSALGSVGTPSIYANKFSCDASTLDSNIKTISTEDSNYVNANCTYNGNISSKGKVIVTQPTVNGDVCSTSEVVSGGNVKGEVLSDCVINGSMYGYKPVLKLENSIKVTEAQCSSFPLLKDLIEAQTKDKFIDLSECVDNLKTLERPSVEKISLSANITLVSKSIFASNLVISSAGSEAYNFNFIIPSTVEDSSNSTHPSGNNREVQLQNVSYEDGVSGMLYSTQNVSVYNSNLTGQIYAGAGDAILSNTNFKALPITLQGTTKSVSTNNKIKPLVRVF